MKNKIDDWIIRLYEIMPKNHLPGFFLAHVATITERRKNELQSEMIRLKWDLIRKQEQLEQLRKNN